jgi:hypothetical protein
MPVKGTSPDVNCPFLTRKKNPLFLFSLCHLRELPQQKIPRELLLCLAIFLCSHGKIFFDETDQENWKTEGGKRQIRKIHKNYSIKKTDIV